MESYSYRKSSGDKCKTCPYKCEKCKKYHPRERHTVRDTLCWCCEKSTIDGCDWMAHKIPVKGWEAIRRINNDKLECYRVLKCPEFVRG